MNSQGTILWQVEPFPDMWIPFFGGKFFQINAVRDNFGRSTQPVIIEQIEGCGCWCSCIFATVAKVYQVRVGNIVQVFPEQRICYDRMTYIDRQIMISGDNWFSQAACENLGDIAQYYRRV